MQNSASKNKLFLSDKFPEHTDQSIFIPSRKQSIFLQSVEVKLIERICWRCGYTWMPMRLNSYNCSKCGKRIGLSAQALQYIEAFKENGEKLNLPILDDKTREGLIEEAVKGVSDLVGKKVDEKLGSALGNIAGIFLRKFTPYIEDKIGNIDLGDFKIPTLDSPEEIRKRKISGCSPEEADRYRKLFGWESGVSSRDVPLDKRVTTPLPTTPRTKPKTTKAQPTAPEEAIPEEPISQQQQSANLFTGLLGQATPEQLEGYLNVQGLEFGLKPHIELMDEEQKLFIWENLTIELVYNFLEQQRPDLMPILKSKKGIKWATNLINGVKLFCKPEKEPQQDEGEKEGDEANGEPKETG